MSDQEQKIEKNEGTEGTEQSLGDFVKKAIEKKRGAESILELEKGKERLEAADFEKAAKEKIQKNVGSDNDGKNDQGDDKKKELELHAEDILKIQDAEEQIEKLVELATNKDPIVAINVARHLDENYVLDKFHDKLMEDEIRKVLIERGLIKED